MRVATTVTALATIILAQIAHADFVIVGQRVAATMAAASSLPDVQPPPPAPDRQTTAPDPPRPPQRVHWKMAHGFGHQIPLAFAVKQIVPPAVRVTYGPGADPSMLVDWKGGDTWNHVLLAAVRPIGLRLVMTHMVVEIRK